MQPAFQAASLYTLGTLPTALPPIYTYSLFPLTCSSANATASATPVAAVPAIIYSNGRCGPGITRSTSAANTANIAKEPESKYTARLILSVTIPF